MLLSEDTPKILLVNTLEMSTICFLKLVDLSLVVPLKLAKMLWGDHRPLKKDEEDKRPIVVVVGCNFAGITAMQHLVPKADRLRIILIDQRDHFEYTPGVLRVLCKPDHFDMVARKIPRSKDYEFIHGKVTSIIDENASGMDRKVLSYLPVTVNNAHNGETKTLQTHSPLQLNYDFLILATGATYPAPVWPTTEEWTLTSRKAGWKIAHEKLRNAKTVAILGGGPVGVELAAEILDFFPSKRVTIVEAESNLVPLHPPALGKYALKWLQKKGAKCLLNQKLVSWTATSFTLPDDTVIEVDVVYNCFGASPNSAMVKNKLLGESSPFVAVDNTLKVTGGLVPDGSIYAVGDVADPISGREKQALQAEAQGHVAAHNVMLGALGIAGAKPMRYPQDLLHSETAAMPLAADLSLGRYDGILLFNGISVPGPLTAVFKWLLEYTKVKAMEGNPLWQVFWGFADEAMFVMSRSILKRTDVPPKIL